MSPANGVQTACELSVIVPVFNEAESIQSLVERLEKTMDTFCCERNMTRDSVEILFVNDGSNDDSLGLLQGYGLGNNCIKILNLSRNYGHQIAITAGLDFSLGNAVAIIDGDLQDPPELIPKLYHKLCEGFDVVYAVRQERPGESWFKRTSANLFYRLLRRITDIQIPMDTGDFRIISRRMVNALMKMRETHRFVRGLVAWAGFKQAALEYQRPERQAGVTKYPFRKMLRFALDGITSFSSLPLRWVSYLGFLTALAGLLYSLVVVYRGFFSDAVVRGWPSLMAAILLLGGIQLLSLGIIGVYLGRVHQEVKARPLYLVEGFYSPSSNSTSEPMRE
jgi:dolichol-phosphate mannosyltransferase